MLKKLYLISQTGQCIYHQGMGQIEREGASCDGSEVDPNLISGFFSAILTFANMMAGQENEVHNISLKNSNFYFIQRNHLHFILESDSTNDDVYVILNKLADLIEDYIERNNIDYSIVQLSGESEIYENVTAIVSSHMRNQILSKFSFVHA